MYDCIFILMCVYTIHSICTYICSEYIYVYVSVFRCVYMLIYASIILCRFRLYYYKHYIL